MTDGTAQLDQAAALLNADDRVDGFTARLESRTERRVLRTAGRLRMGPLQGDLGLGISVRCGAGRGYAATHEFDDTMSLHAVIERALRLARADRDAARTRGDARRAQPETSTTPPAQDYTAEPRGHPSNASQSDFAALLGAAEEAVTAAAPAAKTQVAFGFAATDTWIVTHDRPLVRSSCLQSTLLVQTVLRQDGRVGSGNAWLGGERGIDDYLGPVDGCGTDGRGGPATFYPGADLEPRAGSVLDGLRLPDLSPDEVRRLTVAEALGRAAAREAIEAIHAKPLTGGRQRTLTDNHLTGMMVHESFGHLTEYDLVASGWSVLQGRLGERLAADLTIVDAPTTGRPREGVVVPFDSDGVLGRPVTLLERGHLNAYMHSDVTAALPTASTHGGTSADAAEWSARHTGPTGNGRAIDVDHEPLVRMRNTFMMPGKHDLESAIDALGTGAYLIGGRGGSPRADGSFMFTAQRGYLMERGQAVAPLHMTSIQGNVLDFLSKVEATTRDHRVFTTYFGGCGKWDQSFLHIGSGGPHVLVSEALVGGRA